MKRLAAKPAATVHFAECGINDLDIGVPRISNWGINSRGQGVGVPQSFACAN